MGNPAETLVVRLGEALERARLTQRELAARVHRHESTISGWLDGRTQPRVNDLAKLRQALGVSIDWLLGLDEAPSPPEIPPGVRSEDIRPLLRVLETVAQESRRVAELLLEQEADEVPPPQRRKRRRA